MLTHVSSPFLWALHSHPHSTLPTQHSTCGMTNTAMPLLPAPPSIPPAPLHQALQLVHPQGPPVSSPPHPTSTSEHSQQPRVLRTQLPRSWVRQLHAHPFAVNTSQQLRVLRTQLPRFWVPQLHTHPFAIFKTCPLFIYFQYPNEVSFQDLP